MIKHFFLLLTIWLTSSTFNNSAVFAQSNKISKNIIVEWIDNTPQLKNEIKDKEEQLLIYDTNDGYKLFYQFKLDKDTDFSYSITNPLWKDGRQGNNAALSQKPRQIAFGANENYGIVEILIKEGEQDIEDKIEAFDLSIRLIPTFKSDTKRLLSANSVLNNGDWYKFGIPSTGMYQLSYDFLASMGIDVDNIPVSNYSVFGHNGGMLSKFNNEARVDDLNEIPIQVVSNSNTLQPGDYLIFYGEGPEKWNFDVGLNRFVHDHHLYSDEKTYFITPNVGSGKRVQTNSLPSGSTSSSYSNFDDYAYVEQDLVNLNKSGSDWLGDEFGISLQKSYTFDFPNLNSSTSARLDSRVAGRASSTSSFNFQHNGNNIVTSSLNSVNLGSYTAPIASSKSGTGSFSVNGDQIKIDVIFNQPNFNASGWLDYIALNVSRSLSMSGNQMDFRVIDSKNHNIVSYNLQNINGQTSIWDVSDLFNIQKVNASISGSTATFKGNGITIKEYIAFNTIENTPTAIGKINNQNLHGLADADMVIVTKSALLQPANELASFRNTNDGLITHVVTLDQVYNEFSSGTNDITAIRDFFKMFFDRNGDQFKYALLLGDGSFNNKALEDFDIPTYQSTNTITTLETYVSDDFYAFLNDTLGDNVESTSNKLDIAIGRIPAGNLNDANIAVKKIIRYASEASYGNWRNIGTYVADDEDSNLHFAHAQENSDDYISDIPNMNIEKIYLDAYRQEAGSGGGFYPDVNEAIAKRMFKGTLFMNYIGHGGTNGLAEERVVRLEDIDAWDNYNKLSLFISATCEFTRYDDFESFSAGERTFFKEDGGAIALVTTVRLVFASKNRQMNLSFMDAMKDGLADRTMTLGDITKEAKNATLTGSGNRKFTLIGDPSLKLAFPEFNVVTTKVNEQDFVNSTDTLKALTKVTIEGEVRTMNDALMSDFNGLVYPTVYDKVKTVSTLGNDDGSSEAPFKIQNNIIYAGKIQAIGGQFSYTFVVPKDIIYVVGDGKISYYANDSERDAAGSDIVLVGGGGDLDSNSIDNDDPIVDVFMDDESFISGDFTTESPDLLVQLFDDNGINTVGSGVGHDIVAIIDGDNQNGIILNDFYESELNSYQKGKVLYPLEKIPPGTHTVKVKAWDVFNNSGEGATEFVVAESAELALEHVLNYPNPFTTSTKFMFEHNRKGDVVDVRIEIFTVSGKLVKTIQETALSEDRRVELPWDGLDQYGDTIGKGVYIYRVKVKDSSGEKVEAFQKLVLLR